MSTVWVILELYICDIDIGIELKMSFSVQQKYFLNISLVLQYIISIHRYTQMKYGYILINVAFIVLNDGSMLVH